ncbi:hypothetical protein J6590_046835 [Homalodisca vitripennis]|nr:hypothetical protein J6590_046835 [Homalodisca vitripennis]
MLKQKLGQGCASNDRTPASPVPSDQDGRNNELMKVEAGAAAAVSTLLLGEFYCLDAALLLAKMARPLRAGTGFSTALGQDCTTTARWHYIQHCSWPRLHDHCALAVDSALLLANMARPLRAGSGFRTALGQDGTTTARWQWIQHCSWPRWHDYCALALDSALLLAKMARPLRSGSGFHTALGQDGTSTAQRQWIPHCSWPRWHDTDAMTLDCPLMLAKITRPRWRCTPLLLTQMARPRRVGDAVSGSRPGVGSP